jgi:hypothetical protein
MITTMALSNLGTLYIGGTFSTVAGTARSKIAALSNTGALASWYPTGGANNDVRKLAFNSAQTILFVAGVQSAIGGTTCNACGALDPISAAPGPWSLTGFISDATESVFSHPTTNEVYYGGTFLTVNGLSRVNFFSTTSSGTLTSSVPSAYPTATLNSGLGVNVIVGSPSGNVLVGGGFKKLGETIRGGFGILNSSGQLLP